MNPRFFPTLLSLATLLALPAAVSAQAAPYPQLDPQPTARAASPDTPVPPARYQPAFAGLPSGVEQTRIDWKQANAEVGQFRRGHADILKWEQAQEQAAPPGTTGPSGVPSASSPSVAPARESTP